MVTGNKNFIIREKCPVCDGDARVVWHESIQDSWIGPYLVERYKKRVSLEDFADVPYEVRHCMPCDFYFQTFVPTDAFLKNMYIAEGTDLSLQKKQGADISRFSMLAREVERISLLLSKKPHDIRVLEFGAGWGFWSRMAKAYGYEVYGFDTSEPRATYARSQGVEYYTSLDEIADESFDFLFSDQVFEHITDPVDALRRVARALRPGGIARIAVPNASGAASLLKKSSGRPLKELRPLEHINGFTYTSLVRALDKVHLKPLTSLFIAKRLIPRVRPTQNAQYLQDALKFCYSQNHGTTIYFIKE